MTTIHTGIRAYIFDCTYNSSSWISDANSSILVSDIQNLFRNITNLTYSQIKIANIKNVMGSNIEIEIIGITYNSKTKLTPTEIDDLIDDLNTQLLEVQNFSFLRIDICSDIFREEPTLSWPYNSWKRD